MNDPNTQQNKSKPPSSERRSTASLLDRLLADQRHRAEENRSQPVEVYIEQHPELADENEFLLDLLYQEILLRDREGKSVSLEDYQRRFPNLADELAIQFEIDQEFDRTDLTLDSDKSLTPKPSISTQVTSPARKPPSSESHSTSASLLERLKNRTDEKAWERFLSLYAPVLHRWTRRLPLDPVEAEDLVQEIFLLLLDKLPEFRYDPKRSFRGWLFTVSQNKWRELQRRKRSHIESAGTLPNELAERESDSFWESEFSQQIVSRAFHLLRTDFTDNTAEAFRRYVLEGEKPSSVATELGMSLNAVYLAKLHVSRKLRQELSGLVD